MYKINEASEYVLNKIILTYGDGVNTIDFSGPCYNPFGKITANTIRKDKRFFNEKMQIWINQVKHKKGKYMEIITPILYNKIKEINKNRTSTVECKNLMKYCYAIFFLIYYNAKLCFDEIPQKCEIFKILGYYFIIDIYTYCHILSRHYYPSLNKGLPNSMNKEMSFIDINNFVESLKNLIILYFSHKNELSTNTEYLLYEINKTYYILWIKYKHIKELSQDCGFQVRSFYKCDSETDREKFKNRTRITINNEISCYY